ncbi:hypothetical protein BH10BAC5_BH10BAC5_14280 [soil metagenome]
MISLDLNEKKLHTYANIFLGISFFYLIGPTFRFLNAFIADYLFLIFAIHVFFGQVKIKFNFKESRIFLIPFLIILIVTIGKLFSGIELLIDEFANNINYLKLYFMFCISYTIILNIKDVNFLDNYLKNVFRFLALGVIFVSLISIMQFFNFKIVETIIENFYFIQHKTLKISNLDQFNESNRVVGIFDSYNGCGFFMCFFTFILIIVTTEVKSFLSTIAIILGFTTLILTSNRASLITFMIMNFLFFIFIKKLKNIKVIITILSLILLFLILAINVSDVISIGNLNRFLELKDFVEKGQIPFTFADRTAAWEWMPQYIFSSRYAMFGFTNATFLNDLNFRAPDNQYLAWFVTYGIIGAGLLIFWTVYALVKIIKLYKEEALLKINVLSNISGGLVVIWIGLMIEGISQDSCFFGNRWREYFILILSTIAALKYIRSTKVQLVNE